MCFISPSLYLLILSVVLVSSRPYRHIISRVLCCHGLQTNKELFRAITQSPSRMQIKIHHQKLGEIMIHLSSRFHFYPLPGIHQQKLIILPSVSIDQLTCEKAMLRAFNTETYFTLNKPKQSEEPSSITFGKVSCKISVLCLL